MVTLKRSPSALPSKAVSRPGAHWPLPICSVAGRPSKVSVNTESWPGPEASVMR